MPSFHLRHAKRGVERSAAAAGDSAPPGSGPRFMGATSLALISLTVVLTVRGFPRVAEYGWASIVYYLGAVLFLVPLALIAAELAAAYPAGSRS